MDESFAKKVIADLEKSGFGSEMRTIKTFLSNGWRCSGGQYYMDKDMGKTREIDVVAHYWLNKKHSKENYTNSFFYIVGEVKKSDKPWVVFTKKLDKDEFGLKCAWNNLAHINTPEAITSEVTKVLPAHSLRVDSDYLGYGIHESFKPPSESSQWYSAFVSASKAAEYQLEVNTDSSKDNKDSFRRSFIFVQPIVIFDGILLSAELDQNGEIEVKEINEIPTEFRYRTNNYKRMWYRVDLVRLTHLEAYLERCQQRQLAVVDRIQEVTKPQ